MRARLLVALCLSLCGFDLAAAETPYRARKGDTLWDLAGERWKDPFDWPELWSLNPHLRNPHRIEPGDPIFFDRRRAGSEVRLPLEALGGAAQPPAAQPAAGAGTGAGAPGPAKAAWFPLSRARGAEFVSSHRVARWATVDNRSIVKVIYGQGDDVEFRLAPSSKLQPGDVATVFDDARPVRHPVSREPQGYHVRILGQVQIDSVAGDRGIGHLVESYDAIGDGAGLMAYRSPVTRVSPRASRVGVEGVILDGDPEKTLFSTEDVVFLDRGSLHGLEPGALLEVPVPEGTRRPAEGLVDLKRPLARLVVVSVEDKSAAGLIVESRATVSAGDRFVTPAVAR